MKRAITRIAIAAISVITLLTTVVPAENASALTNRCPGCHAVVSQKLTKKTKKQVVITKKISKARIRREYQYKLVNKQYNANKTTERLIYAQAKTVKHTFTATGSASAEFGYANLGLTGTYTYENTKSTAGGTDKAVPGKHYVGFYVGNPMDVFVVDVVKTTKIHCPWCGRLQKTTVKKYCGQAKVPVKTQTLYWFKEVNKSGKFANSFTVR